MVVTVIRIKIQAAQTQPFLAPGAAHSASGGLSSLNLRIDPGGGVGATAAPFHRRGSQGLPGV